MAASLFYRKRFFGLASQVHVHRLNAVQELGSDMKRKHSYWSAAKRPNSRPCRGLHKEGRGGFVWINWRHGTRNLVNPSVQRTIFPDRPYLSVLVGLTPDNPARPWRISWSCRSSLRR